MAQFPQLSLYSHLKRDMEWLRAGETELWRNRAESVAEELAASQAMALQLHHALAQRDATLDECRRQADEVLANEALSIRYGFEEKLREQDHLIDALQADVARLRAAAFQVQQRRLDAQVQVGESAALSASERQQNQQRINDLNEHYESLLASERKSIELQKRHWEESTAARIAMERDAVEAVLDKERVLWNSDRRKLEAALKSSAEAMDDKDSRIAELECTIRSIEQEHHDDRAAAKSQLESMQVLRRSLEDRLAEAVAQHKGEREAMQIEFQRAIRDQAALHDRLVTDERDLRTRVEEELSLLRSDRNRVIGDHRAEMKALEHKLTATQLELTKRIEACRMLEEAQSLMERALADKDRDVREKVKHWEDVATEATKDRASMLSRVADLEARLEAEHTERATLREELEAQGRQREQLYLQAQRAELHELETRHRTEMEDAVSAAEARHAVKLNEASVRYQEALSTVSTLESALRNAKRDLHVAQTALEQSNQQRLQAESDARTVQQTNESLRQAVANLNERLRGSRAHLVSVFTQTAQPEHGHVADQHGASSSGALSTTAESPMQALRRNQIIWSLQAELQEAHEELERLRGPRKPSPPAARLAGTTGSASPVFGDGTAAAGGGGAGAAEVSPWREGDAAEARALFSYFKR